MQTSEVDLPALAEAKDERPRESRKAFGRTLLAILLGGGILGAALAFAGLLANSFGPSPQGVLCVFQSHLTSRSAGAFSVKEYQALRDRLSAQAQVTAYSDLPVQVSGDSVSEKLLGRFITPGYFAATGSSFLLGRDLNCDDQETSGCGEIVLDRQTWKQFGFDLRVVGRSIALDGHVFRIVGVSGDAEQSSARAAGNPHVWVSYRDEPVLLGMDWLKVDSPVRWLNVLTRPATHMSLERAKDLVSGGLAYGTPHLVLTPGQASIVSTLRLRGTLVAFTGAYANVFAWLGLLTGAALASGLSVQLLRSRVGLGYYLAGGLGVILVGLVVDWVFGLALSRYAHQLASESVSVNLRASWVDIACAALSYGGLSLLGFALFRHRQTKLRNQDSQYRFWPSGDWMKYRYFGLSSLLFLAALGYWSNGLFVSDFWEHAAVVRELATHPFHPVNPILPVANSHAGFTPYGLAVGLLARFTGLSAVNALALTGLVNIVLFSWTLQLFVKSKFKAPGTSFYALLYILTLWGFFPWMMSGFLHFGSAIETTSYPSFFAIGVVFLAWYLQVKLLQGSSRWFYLPLLITVTLVILDHPLTAISMAAGLFALTLDLRPAFRPFAALALLVLASFCLALAWPYYSFLHLFTGNSASFDKACSDLYPGIGAFARMTCLALLSAPALIARGRKRQRDFLVVLAVCLALIYAAGGVTGKLTLGRVLFFVLLCLQLALADWLAARSEDNSRSGVRRGGLQLTIGAWALIFTGVVSTLPGSLPAVPIFQDSYGQLSFLQTIVGQYDTVLADVHTSLKIPALSGKVIAYPPEHVLFFVNNAVRSQDTADFFSSGRSAAARKAILEKYRPGYVLISKQWTEAWPEVIRSLQGLVSDEYADGDIMLFKVREL